jgi:hypothetical protein
VLPSEPFLRRVVDRAQDDDDGIEPWPDLPRGCWPGRPRRSIPQRRPALRSRRSAGGASPRRPCRSRSIGRRPAGPFAA